MGQFREKREKVCIISGDNLSNFCSIMLLKIVLVFKRGILAFFSPLNPSFVIYIPRFCVCMKERSILNDLCSTFLYRIWKKLKKLSRYLIVYTGAPKGLWAYFWYQPEDLFKLHIFCYICLKNIKRKKNINQNVLKCC